MTDAGNYGTDWTESEINLIVADYFAMLADELAGRPYVKAHHNAALREKIGRTAGSIERKHMNISAVLDELHLPYINGYKPYSNFQDALGRAIERYLIDHPDALHDDAALPLWARAAANDAGRPSATPGFADVPALFMDETAPPPGAPRQPRPAGLERLVRKFDPVVRDARNRALGKAGEELVVDFERRRLALAGRKDLASKVRWVAQEEGDGAGYDVLSFALDEQPRLIEVKTTRGPRTTPFFISRNELSLAEERPEQFRLYRLYEVAQSPRSFILKPPLDKAATLEPETWRARVG